MSNETDYQLISKYFLPVISLLGFLFNFICILVFRQIISNRNVKYKILYKYLLIASISNSIAMLIDTIYWPLMQYANDEYITQVIYLYGFIYLTDVLETFSSMIDIIIAIDRYATISKNFLILKRINYKIISIFLLFATSIYYIPFLVKKQITLRKKANDGINNSIIYYETVSSNFGSSKFGSFFIFFQMFISEILVLFIMIGINIQLAIYIFKKSKTIKLRRNSANQASLTKQKSYKIKKQKSSNQLRVTLMVFFIISLFILLLLFIFYLFKIITLSIITLVGNFPIIIIYTITIFFKMDQIPRNNLIYAISNLFTVIAFGFIIFIYYYFDVLFKKTLKQTICKIKKFRFNFVLKFH